MSFINPLSTERRIEEFLRRARKRAFEDRIVRVIICIVGIVVLLYVSFFISPSGFPPGETVVSIEEGVGLREVAHELKARSIIRSGIVFQMLVILMGGEREIKHGDYGFEDRQNVITVAWRLRYGHFDIEPRRVFIPEGATNREIGILASERLHNFDKKVFAELTKDDEGYLFPDTYFFLPSDGAAEVRQTMRLTFDEKTARLNDQIRKSGRTVHEIVTMASIIEEEAKTFEARRVISGILWKRIEMGIPLQVDAVFLYINGKNTFELTLKDLKIDNPYNTYKYKGLPPGPISNPGLDSIEAALEPIKTPYLFYLSDYEGNMHYGRDFEEHKRNRAKYLP